MSHETLIIGGGFAGLAAGVALAGAGRRVRLIEQRPYLGGRARSFRHAVTGATVDNGQHIFMGCYHETIKFLKAIGTVDCVRFQPRLSVHFVDRDEGITSLDCPALPAPWHLLAGVLKSNSFGFAEKMQVLRLGRSLRSTNPGDWAQNLDGLTVDDWMARLGQSEKLRRKFWDLLCIAALNEDPRIAAASVFEPVLRLALFQSASDSRIGLAAGGLSECYTEAAAAFIRAHRGEVGVGCQAFELLISGEDSSLRKTDRITCRGVRLADGSVVEGDAVISAVPCFELARLLPQPLLHEGVFFHPLTVMRPTPIISVNLWFDREITDMEFAGLRGTTIQWLFNKRKILRSGEPYISLVISGAHKYIERSKDELLALVLGELRDLFPAAREAKLVHSLVVKERFATFSPCVAAARQRLASETPVRGLHLAGDWTATGLPATIESAVKSGYTAAADVMRANRA